METAESCADSVAQRARRAELDPAGGPRSGRLEPPSNGEATPSALKPLRLLIVEDSPHDAELIVRLLVRAGYTCDWTQVDREEDFLRHLQPDLDVILCDCQMPEFDGMQALKLVQESGFSIPLIIVSGSIGEETAVAAIRAGAADYLLKDRLARMGQAIEHAIEQNRLRLERRAMTEALGQAESRYRGIFENAVEGIFQAVPEGRLLAANPAMARILGFATPAEAIGCVDDILEQLCPEPARCGELRQLLAEHHLVAGFETQVLRRDGARIWATVNCRVVRSADGATHFEGTVEETTERKKLEEQLFRAQRLESVGRLASGIAHDLNNILLPILMTPGLLRVTLKDEESIKMVDAIEISARRGADIVRQLLTFGRGTDSARIPVQLRGLVQEMLNIVRETFPKNITIRCSLPTDVWSVRGDPTQLHQVMMNLCVNARDAMADGGDLLVALENREVDAELARRSPGAHPGRYVVLRVSDSGTGIAPEHLDKIYDPFFTTKEVGQGTGLGLSSVLGIVNSHGGFIQIDSTLGQGTQFRIFLPASLPAEIGEAGVAAPEGPRGQGELVLLVDDERAVRYATRTMLERNGYRVVEARDGVDGLARFAEVRDDVRLVVVDLLMPRLDGVGLIRQLRKQVPALAILATTGVGRSPKVEEVKQLGNVPILEKPFVAETMLDALARLLGRVPTPGGK
ncbi:MAG: response regulator [Opitutaceae bacterium]|nr:response regulator [Opitutaceae bacterium]